jgi:hypothetical protein
MCFRECFLAHQGSVSRLELKKKYRLDNDESRWVNSFQAALAAKFSITISASVEK